MSIIKIAKFILIYFPFNCHAEHTQPDLVQQDLLYPDVPPEISPDEIYLDAHERVLTFLTHLNTWLFSKFPN